MYNQESEGNYPFPIPISPNMPMEQQFSLNSLNPGMNPRPLPALSLLSSLQYKNGGHIQRKNNPSLEDIIEHIRQRGEEGDDILAYINPEEAQELDYLYGHDINPYTGLPQYGFFGKIFSGIGNFVKRNILPIGGAVLGNLVAPGIGGVVGGMLGGAASAIGSKKPLQTALTGGLLGGAGGALQGFGLPALGKVLSASGMPNTGLGLMYAGQSRFVPAVQSLAKGIGISSLVPATGLGGLGTLGATAMVPHALSGLSYAPRNDLSNVLSYLSGGTQQTGNQLGNLGNILNYLLLGLSVAGVAGGKTKYKIPEEYKKEPSPKEIMEAIAIKPSEKDKSRQIPAYTPPPSHFAVPQVTEVGYQYPKFKKGGRVKFPGGGPVEEQKKSAQVVGKKAPSPKPIQQPIKKAPSPIKTKSSVPTQAVKSPLVSSVIPQKAISPKPAQKPPIPIQKAPSPKPILQAVKPSGVTSLVGQKTLAPQPTITPAKPPVPVTPARRQQDPMYEFVSALQKALGGMGQPSPVISTPSQTPQELPSGLSPEVEKELKPLREFFQKISSGGPAFSPPSIPAAPSPLFTMGGLLGNEVRFVPEEEEKEKKPVVPSEKIPIQAYMPPPFVIPEVIERGFQYPKFKKGGYIDGISGGQDDNRKRDLPEGGYVIDATTVSLIGDGNSKAGKRKLDDLLAKFSTFSHFSKGSKVQSSVIPAMVSDGEYFIEPKVISSIGKGNNNMGAKIIKKMISNIRNHKKVRGLPPKSKPLSSYMMSA
jgi:hypothetical protein